MRRPAGAPAAPVATPAAIPAANSAASKILIMDASSKRQAPYHKMGRAFVSPGSIVAPEPVHLNLNLTKALVLAPPQPELDSKRAHISSVRIPCSDGDGHDHRHACRRLHTQRRGRPGFFQGRTWLALRRCR